MREYVGIRVRVRPRDSSSKAPEKGGSELPLVISPWRKCALQYSITTCGLGVGWSTAQAARSVPGVCFVEVPFGKFLKYDKATCTLHFPFFSLDIFILF